VLLLHGSGPGVTAAANWRAVIPALSADRRVIAPDQFGFGATATGEPRAYGRAAWTAHAPWRASSAQLRDLLPDARLHVLAGCGHWTMIEKTADFLAVVLPFLAAEGPQKPAGPDGGGSLSRGGPGYA
jgi:pimeloyl-ACP methyl ester carboxylesterase